LPLPRRGNNQGDTRLPATKDGNGFGASLTGLRRNGYRLSGPGDGVTIVEASQRGTLSILHLCGIAPKTNPARTALLGDCFVANLRFTKCLKQMARSVSDMILRTTVAMVALALPWAAHGSIRGKQIEHVIMIMQENRSFDNYFGTYPGANGFPVGTCVPLNPAQPSLGCVPPFHDQHDVNAGGPHAAVAAQADIDNLGAGPLMDGFVYQQTTQGMRECPPKIARFAPGGTDCAGLVPGTIRHDVMGYHDANELGNYWAYAQHFVLQDQMFESVRGWSGASHLDMTSEWSAACTNPAVLSTCTTSPYSAPKIGTKAIFPWVNLFQLMDIHGVSWKYYLGRGTEPDCEDGEMTCEPQQQLGGILSVWNPAPGFAWVEAQGTSYLAAHNPEIDQFLLDVKNGTLPLVSWIVPAGGISEHPPNGVTEGMMYTTSLINAVMQSPYWNNTAIFLAWDDWGGFYEHVIPPTVDMNATSTPIEGYGLRVPGLLISAWAKPGYIDHHVLSFNAYAVLIEDLFMAHARLDPVVMGQPDSRPTVRDELTSVTFPNGAIKPIGKLIDEFDFTQATLPPLVLSTHVPSGIAVACGSADMNNPQNCTTSAVKISWHSVSGSYIPGPFTYQVLRDGVALAGKCVTSNTNCLNVGVPAGAHFYTVYSVDSANISSPVSAAAEADVP
jgi:phospholipase C